MKERKYYRDEITGAVIFQDSDVYAKRRKLLNENIVKGFKKKDDQRVINSLRNEITELKELMKSVLEK